MYTIMHECNQGNQQGNPLNRRMYKALLILIFGVILLCALECILLLRSPQCYVQEGYYYQRDKKHNKSLNIKQSQQGTQQSTINDEGMRDMRDLPSTATPKHHTILSTIQPTQQNTKSYARTTEMLVSQEEETQKELFPPLKESMIQIARYNTQLERQRILREYCRNSTDLQTVHRNVSKAHMLYSDNVGLVYCYVPKVACTNWKRLLRVFNGKSKDPLDTGGKERVHKLGYPSFYKLNNSEGIEWRKNVYYSFMFVRHPFERVLSAYRNKLQDPYNPQYRRVYGSKILRYFRRGLTKEEYKSGLNVTFEEFVDYIILTYEKFGARALNEHWQIMHNLCTPCSMKYNFIGKMETLLEDAEEVLSQIGWNDKVNFPANATDKYKERTNAIMKEYYGQVSRESIDRLYEIYRPDFLAFGYRMDEY